MEASPSCSPALSPSIPDKGDKNQTACTSQLLPACRAAQSQGQCGWRVHLALFCLPCWASALGPCPGRRLPHSTALQAQPFLPGPSRLTARVTKSAGQHPAGGGLPRTQQELTVAQFWRSRGSSEAPCVAGGALPLEDTVSLLFCFWGPSTPVPWLMAPSVFKAVTHITPMSVSVIMSPLAPFLLPRRF